MNVFEDPCLLLISILTVFTAWFLRRVVRLRLPMATGFSAALQFVTSLLVASLMILHTAAVVVYRVIEKKSCWVQNEPHIVYFGVPYDFRIYSLVLLGAVMTFLAARGMIAANGIMTKSRQSVDESIRINTLLLLIAFPALPLQPFAAMVAIPASVALLVLHAARKSLQTSSIHHSEVYP
jgi:hypothetical protein